MAGPNVWWSDAQDSARSARTLKAAGHARQAYQQAGQAVEFALKAVYMKRKGLSDWPPEFKGPEWHSLPRIAEQAGLGPDLARLKQANKTVYGNWLTARNWDSNGRFPGNAPSSRELSELFLAICHERDGIMGWLESVFQNA